MSWNTKPDLVVMIVCAFFICAITGYIGFTTNDLVSSMVSVAALILGLLLIKLGRSK